MTCPASHYTPIDIVQELLKDISFVSSDLTLEPCAGRTNNIYNLIPGNKERCEIEDGLDFFQYTGSPTKIITNPPYKSNDMKENISIKIMEHSLKVCTGECWFLLNNQMVNSLTPCRLHKYLKLGFKIVFIRILNIPCWYGRYSWICFKKGDWIQQDTKSFCIVDGRLPRHRESTTLVHGIDS
jgi:hypothetical protein